MGKISLQGIDKAGLLAALYNGASPQGMGFLHYDPAPMEAEEARALLNEAAGFGCYFDYLKGRCLKVDLSGDELDPWGYDHDYGQGAALKVVERLRGGTIDNSDDHQERLLASAERARSGLSQRSRSVDGGIVLGLGDHEESLRPAIDNAVGSKQ